MLSSSHEAHLLEFKSFNFLNFRYTSAAQELVVHARGQPVGARGLQWRIPDPFEPDVFTVASSDDISVFVIPLRFAICPVNVDEDVEMLQ